MSNYDHGFSPQYFPIIRFQKTDTVALYFRPVRTLEHENKLLREAENETMSGQRASRMARWIQTSQDLRAHAGFKDPETIQTLAVISVYKMRLGWFGYGHGSMV